MSDNDPQREPPLRVLGIGGSTRRGSKSLILLRSALRTIEEAGAAVTLSDVRTLDLPIYDGDRPLESYPPALHELLALVRAADAFIFCSPTYHGTVSGAVKNVLDALDYPHADDPPYLAGKPVALMALGGGGAANVLNSLHHATRALNGLTIPTAVIAHGSAIREGEISDEAVRRRPFSDGPRIARSRRSTAADGGSGGALLSGWKIAERTKRANLEAGGRSRCRRSHTARDGASLRECAAKDDTP